MSLNENDYNLNFNEFCLFCSRYYSDVLLNVDPKRVPPHLDGGISDKRKMRLKRYFSLNDNINNVYLKFSKFSSCSGDFASFDSIDHIYIV